MQLSPTVSADGKTVTMTWAAIPGAEGYIYTLDGDEHLIDGKRHFTMDGSTTSVKMGIPQDGKAHDFGVVELIRGDMGSFSYDPNPPPPPPPPPPTGLNTVAHVLESMQPPNEGTPHSGAGLGNAVLSYNMPPPNTGKLQGWGVVTVDTSNVFAANTRIEIKNFESYVWSVAQGKWIRVQTKQKPDGAYWQFTGSQGTHHPVVWRTEPDGGVSAVMESGYVLHFFPNPQYAIPDQSDIAGGFTTYQARMILDDAGGADNLDAAKFVAQSGADWWAKAGGFGPPVPNTSITNVALGGGKWVYLSRDWRAISFYTGGPPAVITASTTKYQAQAWTEARLQQNPPPLDGMGLPGS